MSQKLPNPRPSYLPPSPPPKPPSATLTELDTIARLQEDNDALNLRVSRLTETLEHIIEYWNRDENEKAMSNALWHIIDTATSALEEKR